uniref:BTB domain-containing protein n=1 Tax=Timema bartmani TaxID=61472 RepID=A0A7R9EP34_9NEOP|nr:unnamed protein product [Timema bartmani]
MRNNEHFSSIIFKINNIHEDMSTNGNQIHTEFVKICNINWKLGLYNAGGWLGLFLYCGKVMEDQQVKLYVESELQLISQEPNHQPSVKQSFYTEFNSKIICCGARNFVSTTSLFSQPKAYIRDGSLSVMVSLAIGPLLKNVDLPLNVNDAIQKDVRCYEEDSNSNSTRGHILLNEDMFSDCEFWVGTKDPPFIQKASMAILSLKSPVFFRMFTSEQDKISNKHFVVNDIDPSMFLLLLQHIYSSKIRFETKLHTMEVFRAAKRYELNVLMGDCIRHLWPHGVSDVWEALDFSTANDVPTMKEVAMNIVRRQASEVLFSERFRELSYNSVLAIVEQYQMNCSELDIFDAVLRWACYQCEKEGNPSDRKHLRSCLKDILRQIRFLAMGSDQFMGSPCSSGILTGTEELQILKFLVDRKNLSTQYRLCHLTLPRMLVLPAEVNTPVQAEQGSWISTTSTTSEQVVYYDQTTVPMA